jgi:hypothetical protein
MDRKEREIRDWLGMSLFFICIGFFICWLEGDLSPFMVFGILIGMPLFVGVIGVLSNLLESHKKPLS